MDAPDYVERRRKFLCFDSAYPQLMNKTRERRRGKFGGKREAKELKRGKCVRGKAA